MSDQRLNIFRVFASADKELVHSAMIKFFLRNDFFSTDNFSHFIGLPNIDSKPEVQLELSNTNPITKEKIRFDIYGTLSFSDMVPFFIIENKFKSTPTVTQLKIYDDYLSSSIFSNVHKVLFVFSLNQMPCDLIEYCRLQEWKVLSYVSLKCNDQGNNDLLSWLSVHETYPIIDQKSKIIIEDYRDYLQDLKCKIYELISNPNFVSYKTISNRFIYFQYLLYMQKEISDVFLEKGFTNIKAHNDGGKNVIPGFAFWIGIDNEKFIGINSAYSAIDGDTFKLGISYQRKEDEKVSYYINQIKNQNDKPNFYSISLKKNSRKLKSINMVNESKQDSVYSIFIFDILAAKPLKDVVSEIANISLDYFQNFLFTES